MTPRIVVLIQEPQVGAEAAMVEASKATAVEDTKEEEEDTVAAEVTGEEDTNKVSKDLFILVTMSDFVYRRIWWRRLLRALWLLTCTHTCVSSYSLSSLFRVVTRFHEHSSHSSLLCTCTDMQKFLLPLLLAKIVTRVTTFRRRS